jgi:hypothetical protein
MRFSPKFITASREKGRGEFPALPLALIHPSAWNRNSANFALTEFSEVRGFLGALMCFVPWRTYIPLSQEYAAFVT